VARQNPRGGDPGPSAVSAVDRPGSSISGVPDHRNSPVHRSSPDRRSSREHRSSPHHHSSTQRHAHAGRRQRLSGALRFHGTVNKLTIQLNSSVTGCAESLLAFRSGTSKTGCTIDQKEAHEKPGRSRGSCRCTGSRPASHQTRIRAGIPTLIRQPHGSEITDSGHSMKTGSSIPTLLLLEAVS
jgi:hypothetical protein